MLTQQPNSGNLRTPQQVARYPLGQNTYCNKHEAGKLFRTTQGYCMNTPVTSFDCDGSDFHATPWHTEATTSFIQANVAIQNSIKGRNFCADRHTKPGSQSRCTLPYSITRWTLIQPASVRGPRAVQVQHRHRHPRRRYQAITSHVQVCQDNKVRHRVISDSSIPLRFQQYHTIQTQA